MSLDSEHEAMKQETLREQQKEKEADEAYFNRLNKQEVEPKAYPCGKAEMDIIQCPDCLDHFSECAAKSRQLFHGNIMAYMEIRNTLAKHKAEDKKRLHDRAKCRSLAQRILKKKQEIAEMRKELSKIFYYDGSGRVFNHTERVCDPKNGKIREALRD